uniref:SecY-independent transporter protein n=1 Tax=Rhodomonas salina TaxID=3034 RepID=Q9G8U2_RHDSA|nr:SecY-independent transporter protein [Rhodomonas salina]AAG17755.1 SecY-independent transporter protein [Rhodomonas salina]
MNLFYHFAEFKIRFFYLFICFIFTFVSAYINIDAFIFLIIKPLNTNFVFMNLFEGFYCFFVMSFFLSLFFSFFLGVYSFFSFIKCGLTRNEKNVFLFVLKLEFVVGLFSIFFSYNIFLPQFIYFLLSFEQSKTDNLFNFFFQARLLDYIFVFWSIFFSAFFLFQIPFLIFLCVQFRIIDNNFLIRLRREFIIFFFLIGCILSPPDIYSQILLAFPCVFLYEIVIFFFIFTKNFLESCSNG